MRSLSIVGVAFLFGLVGFAPIATAQEGDYADVIALFREFRAFAQDNYRGDIAGYPEAMKEQLQNLKTFQQRLADIESSDWPVPQQVTFGVA